MTTVDEQLESADTETGRYRLDEIVGRGGMATVYRAFDRAAEMEVAAKVLHEHLAGDEGIVEAFEREAQLMRSVDHPGVVRVFETTEIEGRPAITMQLCEGGDLADRLARRGRLDEDEAVETTIQLLEALTACHTAGVIHRDDKPHNILFDDDGDPVLVDFGIGQAEELMAADESGQLGTVEYMAPERIDGLVVDARSDIYGVGILLFELLVGHVPYRADSATEVFRMHREADPSDPKTFVDDISAPVAEATVRAMATHPEDRFDDATQMIDALRGDAADRVDLPVHRRWRALEERFGQRSPMAAPIEEQGHEWVVFVPLNVSDENITLAENLEASLEKLFAEFGDYQTVADITIANEHPGQTLNRFGVARGLSREGADEILSRLDDAGVPARRIRRPRSSVEEPVWQRWLTGLRALNVGISLMWIVPFLAVFLIVSAGPEITEGVFATFALLVGAVYAGAAIGWMVVSDRFREWWMSRISREYIFDFARRPSTDLGGPVDEDHFEVSGQLTSSRTAASFRRATNLALHLDDRLDDSGAVDDILDSVRDLGRQIAELETEVAALRPAEASARIRQLDRQIAESDDIEDVEPMMEQKSELRRQLTDRDESLQQLQRRTQQLHEIGSSLQDLTRDDEVEAPEVVSEIRVD